MTKTFGLSALGAACLLTGAASGQTFTDLQFGDFETPDTLSTSLPQGWNAFNGARRRVVGDGLTPTLGAAHGGTAVIELTPQPSGNSDFVGFSSNDPLDPLDVFSPRNNVGYLFDPPDGPGLNLGCWFMIPASDPVVGQRAGLKLEFRRTVNDSVYEGFDFFFVDPADPTTVPGLVGVTTPTGAGVHTNGQWLQFTGSFLQSQFALNGLGEPNWPLPPVNPDAKVSLLAIRFGLDYAGGARGTVFFDDLTLERDEGCVADFNGSGAVTVQDIFDFLSAYFGNEASADFNRSGAISVQDIFDFLAAYFIGCP